MTKRDELFAVCAIALAVASGCFDTQEPQAGGHTNWLECHALDDCAASAAAANCWSGYCVDADGHRVAATGASGGHGAAAGSGTGAGAGGMAGGPIVPPHAVPSDWVAVDARCGYGFRAPPQVREETVQGEDSCVDRYLTDACTYDGGYGAYDLSFEDWVSMPEYTQTQQLIDGRQANLITARGPAAEGSPYMAAADFGRDADGLYFDVYATCRDKAGQSEALQVFQTMTRPTAK